MGEVTVSRGVDALKLIKEEWFYLADDSTLLIPIGNISGGVDKTAVVFHRDSEQVSY